MLELTRSIWSNFFLFRYLELKHALRAHNCWWATNCWKSCHLKCADLHLRCLEFNAPFFLQTKTPQDKMLKLTSRNISSNWQTQYTLLKEWVWTIHLAAELAFSKNIGKKCQMHSPNEVVPVLYLYEIMQKLRNILRIAKN